jgi:hypothetical protein
MTTLADAWALAAADRGLAVVSTLRADGSIQSSVVNVGVLAHPVSGAEVLGFVTFGRVKLANLRARPQIAVTRSSPRPAASMTTGTATTGSWRPTAAPPCSSCRAEPTGLPFRAEVE